MPYLDAERVFAFDADEILRGRPDGLVPEIKPDTRLTPRRAIFGDTSAKPSNKSPDKR